MDKNTFTDCYFSTGTRGTDDPARCDPARRTRHGRHDLPGSTLFPWLKAIPLPNSTALGIDYSFLTNNPSKNIDDYLHKLEGMGIGVPRERMYTSALATIDHIRTHHPEAKRLFLLGTPSMIAEFEAAGFESAPPRRETNPICW